MNRAAQVSNPHPAAASAYVVRPGESEQRRMGETVTHFLATGATTGNEFCLVDETAKFGETVPLHRHPDDMESFYVLEGTVALFIGDGPAVAAGPGSFAHVPGGTIHGFRIESEKARYLILTTPRHGEFYRAITNGLGPDGEPKGQPIDGAVIKEACEKFGIEFIGPLPEAAT